MRSIPNDALTKLATQFGTEPINIVEIQWVKDGPRTAYADRAVGTIRGRILQVSDLDEIIKLSGSGQSQQISIVLDDTDGSIKQILDTQDVHMRPVWVYQWFEGLDPEDKFLIFKGQINTPLEWNEGDRTVRFDVINRIEDVEIGFSIEEGNFQAPPDELIGKPWPLCFGTVINVPALRIKSPRQGVLATGVGIKDFTLEPRLRLAERLMCPDNFAGFRLFSLGTTPWGGDSGFEIRPVYLPDQDCLQSKCTTKEELEHQLAEQSVYEYKQIRIFGGDKFPQDTTLTLDIEGGKFTGKFSGDTFTIKSRRHPDLDTRTGLPIVDEIRQEIQSECGPPPATSEYDLFAEELQNQLEGSPQYINAFESKVSWKRLNDFPTSSFFWANARSTVTLDQDEEIVYVANIIPSLILRVAAWRTVNGSRQLLTVPESYYTLRQVDYGTYQVMEIVFTRPLSRRDLTSGGGWSDDIYVSLVSDVGPNTVDILEWLIETYTEYNIDSSFAAVRELIDNYPMNFPILERRNLITVLEEIAFQARCALWLKDDTFYLRYLSEEPTADDSIGVSDILEKSLTIFHTPTEELVTKYVAEWRKDYAIEDPNTLILRHNVSKYGTKEEEYDFYCFNDLDLVRKSATFWLIRKANTWRKCSFKVPLTKLNLEVFDTVDLNISHLAANPIKTIVEKATYNSAEHSIDMEVWTPLKSGTQTPYDFAWPANVDEELIFPTLDEEALGFAGSGTGPNFSVIAPPGHPLAIPTTGLFQSISLGCNGVATEVGQTGCRSDYGDRRPSDQGDVKPTVKVEEDTTGGVSVGTSPISTSQSSSNCCDVAKQALKEAQQARQEAKSDSDPTGKTEDDLPKTCGGGCTVTLTQTVVFTTSVVPVGGGGVVSTPGTQGSHFAGTARTECRTFNSMTAAQEAQRTLRGPDLQTVGQENRIGQGALNTTEWGGGCSEPAEPAMTAMNKGG